MDYKIILERPEVKFVPEKFNRGSWGGQEGSGQKEPGTMWAGPQLRLVKWTIRLDSLPQSTK